MLKNTKRFLLKCVVFVSAVIISIIIFFLYKSLQIIPEKDEKYILFWNAFFSDNRWTLPNDTIRMQCPLGKCLYTNKHDLLPSTEAYDAVIYHTASYIPDYVLKLTFRSEKQFYIFAQLESPVNTWHGFSDEKNFYNLTMTYRLDSDFLWTYGNIIDNSTNNVIAPAATPQWHSLDTSWTQVDKDLKEMIVKKKNLVAWFVSNCKTASKREDLVQSLQQYLEVDIYGQCGSQKCERGLKECDKLLENHFKFYLSFENSLCIDYVTEKFFNVVPIVFGGANYTRYGPPHSYIDINDFENVTQLAEYLKYLDKTPMEYARYFWWKRYYKIRRGKLPFCDLCDYLSQNNSHFRHKSYEDIESYWGVQNNCIKNLKIEF